MSSMHKKKFSKPLPYRVCGNSYPINTVAKQLREELRPLMQRRLPTVYFSGFKHGYIINLIKKYKQTHSYFLKLDIKKYYPSPR